MSFVFKEKKNLMFIENCLSEKECAVHWHNSPYNRKNHKNEKQKILLWMSTIFVSSIEAS